MKALNIKWDTDGDKEVAESLPSEIEIPNNMVDTEAISDYLSDTTGFCHYGFELSANVYLVKVCNYDDNNIPFAVGEFYAVSEIKPTEIEIKSMPEWEEIKERLNCEGIISIGLDADPSDEELLVLNCEIEDVTDANIIFDKCDMSTVISHIEDLDVYCMEDMWEDEVDNLYAIKIGEKIVGFISYNDEGHDDSLYVYQMEVLSQRLGIGKATIKALAKSRPGIKAIHGLATFASVPFWDTIGASFASGGEFTVEDAWKYAKENDEELFEEYLESSLAFTISICH